MYINTQKPNNNIETSRAADTDTFACLTFTRRRIKMWSMCPSDVTLMTRLYDTSYTCGIVCHVWLAGCLSLRWLVVLYLLLYIRTNKFIIARRRVVTRERCLFVVNARQIVKNFCGPIVFRSNFVEHQVSHPSAK